MKKNSIILFLIALFSFSACEKVMLTGKPDPTVIRLIPGDCFESSSLRLMDITNQPSEPKLGYGVTIWKEYPKKHMADSFVMLSIAVHGLGTILDMNSRILFSTSSTLQSFGLLNLFLTIR